MSVTIVFIILVEIVCILHHYNPFFYIYISDYVSGGELFTHLYQRERFHEDEVRLYIGEIILALEHLHKVSTILPLKFSFLTK